MKRRTLLSLALAVAAVAGCEKASTSTNGSGALTTGELELFHFLPKGAPIYFAGSYSQLQNLMKSGVGKFTSMIADRMGPGMSTWMNCLAAPHGMKIAAAASVSGKAFEMRLVFAGIKIADIATCGQKASFKVTTDPDGKYVAVELPPPANLATYLALPNGDLYARQTTELGLKASQVSALRPELEGDLAALAQGTAADDETLTTLAAKIDRSKTGWFVGSAAGTPIADKVGEAYGWIDGSSGLALDVTVQIKSAADIDKIDQGITQVRGMADQLPGDFKDVVKNLKFSHGGDHVHFAIALTDAQIKSLTDQLGSMIGPQLGSQ